MTALALPALADCPEGQMLHASTSLSVPGLAPDSFGAQPKVFYRIGTQYGRTEEVPDPEQGLHLLLVVNEPDVWFVNLADHSGKHIVDPGPRFEFHAPHIPELDSAHWNQLEMGTELRFMQVVHATRQQSSPSGPVVYEHSAEGATARLYTTPTDIPLKIDVEIPKATFTIKFLVYECLEPDPALFAKPGGITYAEGQ